MERLMTRALLPGRWNRDGRAVPLRGCAGNCNQGRAACNCRHPDLTRITLTELDDDYARDPECTFPPPAVDVDPQLRGRVLLATATASIALIAFGLLLLFFPHQAESRALVVLVGGR
jgi:hypothetical protein